MARLTKLTVMNYRSVGDRIEVTLPRGVPPVLVGENNAGKSNIVRALDLLLGETWPGTHEPEDHEFWGRAPERTIEITASFENAGWYDRQGNCTGVLEKLRWTYRPTEEGDKCKFEAICTGGSAPRFVSNGTRDQCVCVVVGADRRLSYQLSYVSKWTLLSRLMRKFHGCLISDPERVERLKNQFDTLKTIFAEVPEFAQFHEVLAQQFQQTLLGMTYGLSVDFSAYDPSNFFHSLRVLPHEGGQARTFEELGTGQEQLLALAFAHAYAKAFHGGIILAIEEPEAHLHPLAQEWLARKIREMCSDGLQIVLTTHSPAFVDITGLEGLVLVRKENGATIVKQVSADNLARFCVEHGARGERARADTILPFYASAATRDILAGLFAKKVVLVEGLTEQLALPVYLQATELDVVKEGIAVIAVDGKGNLAKWWRFFTAYGIPAYVLFDNDPNHDQEARKRRDLLRTIGLGNNEVDQAIAATDWRTCEAYSVFGEDFEKTLRGYFPGYAQLEDEGRAELGESKPLVARYVAERLPRDGAPGWDEFRRLADRIAALGVR